MKRKQVIATPGFVKILLSIYVCFITSTLTADVDIDFQDKGSEQITTPAQQTPFSFGTYFDYISRAKIKNHDFYKGDHVYYAEARAELNGVFYYNPNYTEGARLGLAYTATCLDWHTNPYFSQDHFYTASLVLSGFTERLEDWFWRSQFSINFDAEQWSGAYTSYDFLLWGRYTYCRAVGVHLGFFAQTGIRLDRIYPILGFDWQISQKWKLNMVYPMNISLEYMFSDQWSFAIAERNFNFRHRIKRRDSFAKGLIRYQNIGVEFMVKYQACGVNGNIHAGTTLGGRYRIANRHNRHAETYKLSSSPYVGAEVIVNF